jgi:hypothetical protein
MQSTAEDTRPIESEGETTIRRLLDAEWLTALEAAPYAGNIGVSIIREPATATSSRMCGSASA